MATRPAARRETIARVREIREDVREDGIDAFPDVLNLLYTSGNFGKLVLKV